MALDREDIGGWVAKLQRISDRFREVEKRVSDPTVAADQEAFASLMIEHRRLKSMASKADELVASLQHWDEAATLASSDDEEMKAMASSELLRLTEVLEQGVDFPHMLHVGHVLPTQLERVELRFPVRGGTTHEGRRVHPPHPDIQGIKVGLRHSLEWQQQPRQHPCTYGL